MSYALWDFETGNAIGEYHDEAEALAVVRENVRTHGPSVVHGVALLATDPGGDSHLIAQGEALLQRLGQRTKQVDAKAGTCRGDRAVPLICDSERGALADRRLASGLDSKPGRRAAPR